MSSTSHTGTNRKVKWLIYSLSIVSLCLVIYRANSLSFTHDESLSYSIIKGANELKNTANHHQLNTVLMDWSSRLFGESELALRLPNVLAYFIFLTVWAAILLRSASFWTILFGSAFLFFNPFLLDYFSLARGYGLSMSFMMVSVYFFIRESITTSRLVSNFGISMIFAGLAAFSSLATINFFIAITVVFLWRLWRASKKDSFSLKAKLMAGLTVLISAATLYLAMQRLFFLQEKGELYFGASAFKMAIETSLLTTTDLTQNATILGYIVSVAITIALVFGFIYRKVNASYAYVALMLTLISIGHAIEFLVFDALLPIERTALYVFPLVYLLFIYSYDTFLAKSGVFQSKVLKTAAILVWILFPLNFYHSFSPSATKTWDYDQHTKTVVDYFKTLPPRTEGYTISNYWLFEPALNYYIKSDNILFAPALKEVKHTTDFIYDTTFLEIHPNYKCVRQFRPMNYGLFKKIR